MIDFIKHYAFVWLLYYPSITVFYLVMSFACLVLWQLNGIKELAYYFYIEVPNALNTKYNA